MKNNKLDVASLVSKLPCGRSKTVSGFGTVRAYRHSDGSRRMAVSNTTAMVPAGGYTSKSVVETVRWELGL